MGHWWVPLDILLCRQFDQLLVKQSPIPGLPQHRIYGQQTTIWKLAETSRYSQNHRKKCKRQLGLTGAPITELTMDQTYPAEGHWKNKWRIVSSARQKRHLKSPIQLSFFILSFVAMASCQISHKKILIFRGSLAFHGCLKALSGHYYRAFDLEERGDR